jgi:polysaccharide export outer membrane protein
MILTSRGLKGDPIRVTAMFLFAAFLAGGCVVTPQRAVVQETSPCSGQFVTRHFPTSLYRLAAGDVLEFLYLTIPIVHEQAYKLSVGDQVDVEFHFHPQMNRTVRVRPDGKISVPRKEDTAAAGLSADELRKKLVDMYSDILKQPEITVTVREYNARLAELQKAISTAPNGQARVITVQPDGNISLPLISEVRAEGKSVPDLTKETNQRYSKLIGDMQVSVILKEVTGNLVFVDGEVAKPGVFTMKGPTTVQEALAMAGGLTSLSEPRSVLVISKAPNGRFFTRVANLANLSSATDYLLYRNDLVYVPKSLIARADLWAEQNITKLLLFTGWGMGLTGDLGRTRSR